MKTTKTIWVTKLHMKCGINTHSHTKTGHPHNTKKLHSKVQDHPDFIWEERGCEWGGSLRKKLPVIVVNKAIILQFTTIAKQQQENNNDDSKILLYSSESWEGDRCWNHSKTAQRKILF